MFIMFTLTPEERQSALMKESDPSVEKSKVNIREVVLNTGYYVSFIFVKINLEVLSFIF